MMAAGLLMAVMGVVGGGCSALRAETAVDRSGESGAEGRSPEVPRAKLDGTPPSYRLDDSGRWLADPSTDDQLDGEETLVRARALLVGGAGGVGGRSPEVPAPQRRFGVFYSQGGPLHMPRENPRWLLDRWIKANEHTSSPLLARAYLLRGDATLAAGDEFEAIRDYELVIRDFPGSPEYAIAVERELEIAIRYIHGLRRRFPPGIGPRLGGASDLGEELLVRVQERMPGSHLAERAAIELADFYYRNREMAAASDAYEIFIVNHPNSEHAMRAHQRRIYANIARFQGPSYDASSLTEAQVLIDEYAVIDPVGAQRYGLTGALTARLEESAAAQQLEKAEWYLLRGDPISARFMLRRLVQTHPRTVSADVALGMLEARGWALSEEAR